MSLNKWDPSSIIILNFTLLFLFVNIFRSSLFVVSQLKYFNLFDLYFNLKFLSKPNIIAFSKYLRNDAKDAPSQVPISNKLNFFFWKGWNLSW